MIRSALLSIALVAISLPCLRSDATETAQGSERVADHGAVLLAYIEAWNTGELGHLGEVVATDFERHAGPDEGSSSLGDLQNLITATRGVYKNLRITLDDYVVDGDRGAFRGSFYGVHRDVNGVIQFPLMGMLRFAEGHITEEWILGDNFLTLVSLGYELLPPDFEAILPSGERIAAQSLEDRSRALRDLETTPRVASARTARPHEALLEAYAEAWKSGEVEGLDSVVAEDFTRHGGYGKAGSRQELERLITGYHDFYRDPQFAVLDSFTGAEKGAMRLHFQGGYGKTGFEMEGTTFSLLRFEGGRIAEEWMLGNTKDFWAGMGYRIFPPGTEMVPPAVDDPPGTWVPPRPKIDPTKLQTFAESTRSDPPRAAGELEILAGVDSLLSLDGEPIGALEAGTSAVLQVEKGEHELRASSVGGSVFYREEIKIKKAKKETVELEAPARVILHSRHQTAEDLETGLMWPLTDNGANITQDAAKTHCDTSEHGGYTDWRLPSIYELESIYDPAAESKRFRTLDGILLTGCCPWTLSPQGDFHWTLLFYNGQRYIKYRTIGKASRALCVRYAGG